MSKKQHIVFLTGWYPSKVIPLNGDFIQRHAEAVALLHKVTVVHVITDSKATKTVVTDKEINGVRTLITYIKPSRLKLLLFFTAYLRLLKKLNKIEVIHVNKLFPVGIVAVYYKWFKGIKYIISEHHHIYHSPYNKKIGFVEKVFSKTITKQAAYVCPVSNNLGSAMQEFGLKGNYHKVPNVVYTDIFTPKLPTDKEGRQTDNDIFTLLHVSNMTALKNVTSILETIAVLQQHIPHFKFYLLGGNAKKFVKMASDLGIDKDNIVFVGSVSQEELAVYYKKADVFLLFSTIETFSCVIYESLSSGTPVISTDVGGIKEHFPAAYGRLVDQGDKEALLRSILEIQRSKTKATAATMHQYIEDKFSPLSIAKQFSKIYKGL